MVNRRCAGSLDGPSTASEQGNRGVGVLCRESEEACDDRRLARLGIPVLPGAEPGRLPVACLVHASRPVRPRQGFASGRGTLSARGRGSAMSQVATRVHDFTITFEGPDEFTVDLADRLNAAGCNDASFGTSN